MVVVMFVTGVYECMFPPQFHVCITFVQIKGLKRNRTERNVKSFEFLSLGFTVYVQIRAFRVSKECMWLCSSAEILNTKLRRMPMDHSFAYALVGKFGEKYDLLFLVFASCEHNSYHVF